MKTFEEEFNFFRRNCTFERLFLKNTFSVYRKEWFLTIPTILAVIGICLFHYEYITLGVMLVIPSLVILFTYLFIKTNQAKKELKENNLPYSNLPYKWKVPEHDDIRIKEVGNIYVSVRSEEIQTRINMARDRIQIKSESLFLDFQSVLIFFGKNYITLFLGFLMGLYSKSDYSSENFRILMSAINLIFFLSFVVSLMWIFLLKKSFTDSVNNKNKQYLDYIFVMENVLLMRL
ncbi:hypothetical protein [Chryseobacterium lathyri]|jgi:hypothetical protein|uniref:Uncharacterized protein n=1 Tax=Chryseobacterium lathyri TaxID=395933 RepID=A0A511YET2_9FLAO|nr:hypothetical protein [Chryseobacterium lathyri]GEN73693.1 hypothetical protein CLA01_37650 [Chryseobacterium lathyri]